MRSDVSIAMITLSLLNDVPAQLGSFRTSSGSSCANAGGAAAPTTTAITLVRTIDRILDIGLIMGGGRERVAAAWEGAREMPPRSRYAFTDLRRFRRENVVTGTRDARPLGPWRTPH